jgi:hypothetical protein
MFESTMLEEHFKPKNEIFGGQRKKIVAFLGHFTY